MQSLISRIGVGSKDVGKDWVQHFLKPNLKVKTRGTYELRVRRASSGKRAHKATASVGKFQDETDWCRHVYKITSETQDLKAITRRWLFIQLHSQNTSVSPKNSSKVGNMLDELTYTPVPNYHY